jgi:hypothetical protein
MIGPAAAPLVLDTLGKLHGAAIVSLRAKELAPHSRALHLFEPRRIGQHLGRERLPLRRVRDADDARMPDAVGVGPHGFYDPVRRTDATKERSAGYRGTAVVIRSSVCCASPQVNRALAG